MSPGLPKLGAESHWLLSAEEFVECVAFSHSQSAVGRPHSVYIGCVNGVVYRYSLDKPQGESALTAPVEEYASESIRDTKIHTLLTSSSGALYAGADNGTIVEWKDGRERVFLHVKEGVRRAGGGAKVLALCEDGGFIFSGSSDGSAMQWDLESGEMVRHFQGGHLRQINVVKAKKGFLFTGSVDTKLLRWDIEKGEILNEYTGHARDVTDIALNEDCTKLFSVSRDSTARCFEVSTEKEILVVEASSIAAARIVGLSGSKFFTGSTDGSVRRFDVLSGVAEVLLDCLGTRGGGGASNIPRCIHISQDQDRVYIGCINLTSKKDCVVKEYLADDVSVAASRNRTPGRSYTPSARGAYTPPRNLTPSQLKF